MLETSARLLRLLSLLQSRRFWSGADLAEELGVTERTVRRDVDKLRSLDYPVHATSGVAGGYRLGAGARLPPLLLSDDEALAVSFGLRVATAGTVTGMEEAALGALSKLGQVLPVRLRERIASMQSAFVSAPFGGPRVDPNMLTVLLDACHEHRQLEFRYGDRHDRTTERQVEPHGLVHAHARWYLVAWDPMRDDWRTFRVDRICGKPCSKGRFAPREIPFGNLASYVANTMDARSYEYQARIELLAPLHTMRASLPPSAGQLQEVGSDRCMLETGAHDLAALGSYLTQLSVDFIVREPPELIEHVRAVGERMQRAAEASG